MSPVLGARGRRLLFAASRFTVGSPVSRLLVTKRRYILEWFGLLDKRPDAIHPDKWVISREAWADLAQWVKKDRLVPGPQPGRQGQDAGRPWLKPVLSATALREDTNSLKCG